MMPPSSHTMKQSAHRAIGTVPALNQIHGANSVGSMCNGQTANSTPTSSFAAALRKLAKKAGDPIIEQHVQATESTQATSGGNHLTDMNSSPNMSSLSISSSSQYKRPPPPPLIQSIHPSSQGSSGSSPPVITISPTPTNLVYNNNSKGLDYSVNRESVHSIEANKMKNNFFDQNGEQSLSSPYNSPKDYPSIPQNITQMRQSCIPNVTLSHLSESVYSSSKSVGFHPYSRQNIAPESQPKTPNMPINSSFDGKSIQYPQFHHGFYQSSVPSNVYRYNSEPLYLEPYPSLLRPSLHPGLVLPPSSHHFSPPVRTQATSYAGHYDSSDFMMSSNSSNTQNQDRIRMEEAQRRRNMEKDIKSTDANNSLNLMNQQVLALNQPQMNTERCPVPESVNSLDLRYDNISPPLDQSAPLSLKKVITEKEPKTSQYSVSHMISSKSSDTKTTRLPTSQLPKERYKQQVQKSLQAQELKLSESIQEKPSDLSVKKSLTLSSTALKNRHAENMEFCKNPPSEHLVKKSVNSMHISSQDYSWEPSSDIGSNRSLQASHYLPVRLVEPRRTSSEVSLAAAKGLANGSPVHENIHSGDKVTKKPYDIKQEVTNSTSLVDSRLRNMLHFEHKKTGPAHIQDSRDKHIFNPAFHDKVTSPSKTNNRLNSVTSNSFQTTDGLYQQYLNTNENKSVLFSKLDRELKRLKEYRRYNKFVGSDQSDDDITDIDEEEFEKHEEIRWYHLKTITSGPPMKYQSNPEKKRFLQHMGLITQRKRSNLETKKIRRQRRLMRCDVFPKADTLVKYKSVEELLGHNKLKDTHSTESKKVIHSNDGYGNYHHHNTLSEKLKFFRKIGLEMTSNRSDERKSPVEINSNQNKSCDVDNIRDHYSPLSEISTSSSVTPFNDIPERNEDSILRKRSHEENDKTDDSTDNVFTNETASATPPKVSLKSPADVSELSKSTKQDEKSNDQSNSSLTLDFNSEKLLSQNFAQEFHNSVLQKTQEQQALKKAAAGAANRSIGPQKGGGICGQLDESAPALNLFNQSEFASQSNLITSASSFLTGAPSSTTRSSSTSSEPSSSATILGLNTPPSSLTSSQQPFKWPGIQAVMEAYERHYDLQKLEKDILASQCQCLKLKNKELANLAEKLRSRMCDLITSKKQLDNERQQRQYAIDNLKRCLKDIR